MFLKGKILSFKKKNSMAKIADERFFSTNINSNRFDKFYLIAVTRVSGNFDIFI